MSGATSLKKDRKTPGVYITELAAFPPSIVGVPTAVPIFVGYTETARDPSNQKPVYLQSIPLTSLADYSGYFGIGFGAKYTVTKATSQTIGGDFLADSSDGSIVTNSTFHVGPSTTPAPRFNLYQAMQLFFANGGGDCFVISVNNYWGTQATVPTPNAVATPIKQHDLLAGLAVANDVTGGTMLVVPDACLLTATVIDPSSQIAYPDYSSVVTEMLRQSGSRKDRMAILDLPGGMLPANWTKAAMADTAQAFYAAIAPAQAYFSYGAAYGPAVESSFPNIGDMGYTDLAGTPPGILTMNNLLTTAARGLYPDPIKFGEVAIRIAAAYPVPAGLYSVTDKASHTGITFNPTLLISVRLATDPAAPADAAGIATLYQYLLDAIPLLGQILQVTVNQSNAAPPSGIMAGVWTANDATRGVWNAPANTSLNQVIKPKVLLTDADQGDYNVPLNGNAIDILRSFVNRGTMVWGARTLDGNSNDYRYIQVRRTLIYIESSIKLALEQFVFASNDGGTWAAVTSAISNFLTQLWQAGGLMGDKPTDAFTVACGVPSTMSGQDVLNGYMIVNVTVQMIHPAEFIELTFTQMMQGP